MSKKKDKDPGKSRVSSLGDRLAEAAAEWQPDGTAPTPGSEGDDDSHASIETQAQRQAIDPAPAPNPEGGNDYVAMIDTPFQIRTFEISEAQQSSEELVLDEGLSADESVSGDESAHPETNADEAVDAVNDELGPELELESPESTDPQLENLARAIQAQDQELEKLAEAASAETEEQKAEELARQIAEDEALAAQMAREAAEAEQALETDPELLAALPSEPKPDADGNLDLSELQSCIETLLFMMDRPVSSKKLQEWLGPSFASDLFEQALAALQARYQQPSHGVELVEVAAGWQLRTKPGRAALAKKLAKIQTQRLSTGGMESLAIIAYRQPVMKEEIDKIRGVDSSYFIRGLLDKKLIAITGRSELPGRPMLYSTTDHFLELFGLKDLAAMPSLRELEQMVPTSQSKNPADAAAEDPRIKEMRRLVDKMKSDTSTSLLYDPKEDEALLTEIRERVKAIPTSTPYLDEQKALEKAAKEGKLDPSAQQPAENLFVAAADAAQQPAIPEGVTPHPEMVDLPPPEMLDEPEPSSDLA